jgi:hypothetical protein
MGHKPEVYSSLNEHILGQFIRIALGKINAFHFAVYEHLGTDKAGLGGAIYAGPGNAYAMNSRLNNNILLGMQSAAKLVTLARRDLHLFANAPGLKAVSESGRRTIITGGQNAFILNSHSTHLSSQAGGTFSHQVGDPHIVFIPGESFLLQPLPPLIFNTCILPFVLLGKITTQTGETGRRIYPLPG